MRHHSERLSRTLAVLIIAAVALILGVSLVGYVGEHIVHNFQSAAQHKGV